MVENSDLIRTSICSGYEHGHWSQAACVYILDRPQTSCVTLSESLTSLCFTSLTDKMWDNNSISNHWLLVSFGCVTNNLRISVAYSVYIHFLSHRFFESAEVLLGLVMASRSWLQAMGWVQVASVCFLILHGPAVFWICLSHRESQEHRRTSQIHQAH